jgi:phosphoglycolate phosphatase-like HAD superfamily hydrolase
MRKILALDFDGVICDGLDECILVTWNGYLGKEVSAFGDEGLRAVPPIFIESFKHCRSFSKHLGHFIMPFFTRGAQIDSQEIFEGAYQLLAPDVVADFMKRVTAYRHHARQEKREDWLRYHRLYPGMQAFLSRLPLPAYIVTAKDSRSVLEILDSAGVAFEESRVFGEQTDKLGALHAILDREGIGAGDLFFFDDYVPNVVQAKQSGFSAYWATWGYQAPDHERIAREHGVPALDLNEFLRRNPACLPEPARA